MSALPLKGDIAPRGSSPNFLLEITLNQVGNFQIIAFGSLA